jgi:hypothetical protein
MNSTVSLFNNSNHLIISPVADVVFQNTITERIELYDASWWWQYQLIFHCFWGDNTDVLLGGGGNERRVSGTPIGNAKILRQIRRDLNRYLRNCIESVSNVLELTGQSRGVLGVSIEDPRTSMTPFLPGPPTPAPSFSGSPALYATSAPSAAYLGGSFGHSLDLGEPTFQFPLNTKSWVREIQHRRIIFTYFSTTIANAQLNAIFHLR